MSGKVGPILRAIRIRSGMTLAEVGEASGFDHSSLSRIEAGQWTPPHLRLVAILNAMSATTADRQSVAVALGLAGEGDGTSGAGDHVASSPDTYPDADGNGRTPVPEGSAPGEAA